MELSEGQKTAVNELKNGAILCGGVGSGKSRTALTYYYMRVCGGRVSVNGSGGYEKMTKPRDLYIITTARKRDTKEWEIELAPFLLSDENNRDVTVVIDSWNNIKKYVDVKHSFFIFDEQRVVGSGAWVKAFLKMTKPDTDNRWILLSATPGDTWSDYIPVFVANGFFRNKTEFLNKHAVIVYNRYGTHYPKIEKYLEEKRLEELRDKILVNIDYDKHTVQHNKQVLCDYDKSMYKRVMKERWDYEASEPIENISKLCYILRKVVNTDESRIEALTTITKLHPKLIVFYNFDYELEILKIIAHDLEIPRAEWNGHKHEPIPSTDSWLYLVQYTAGAEGWNCTKTDTMVFWSQNYSYKILAQSAGRIDRRNTPFTDLYYYHFRSRAPIDIAIYQAIKSKKQFNERSFIKY